MEPTPETLEALRILSDRGDNAVSAALADLGRAASRIVPELVGLSLGLTEGGLTFTLIASSSDIAALDAVQYVEGGPCLEAMRTGQTVETDASGLMDEDRWQAFAQAEAAAVWPAPAAASAWANAVPSVFVHESRGIRLDSLPGPHRLQAGSALHVLDGIEGGDDPTARDQREREATFDESEAEPHEFRHDTRRRATQVSQGCADGIVATIRQDAQRLNGFWGWFQDKQPPHHGRPRTWCRPTQSRCDSSH